jgi:hypothetical protein
MAVPVVIVIGTVSGDSIGGDDVNPTETLEGPLQSTMLPFVSIAPRFPSAGTWIKNG